MGSFVASCGDLDTILFIHIFASRLNDSSLTQSFGKYKLFRLPTDVVRRATCNGLNESLLTQSCDAIFLLA